MDEKTGLAYVSIGAGGSDCSGDALGPKGSFEWPNRAATSPRSISRNLSFKRSAIWFSSRIARLSATTLLGRVAPNVQLKCWLA